MRLTHWIAPLALIASLSGCIDEQNVDENQTSSVTFNHDLNASHERSLNLDNAPFDIPGTPAELVGNAAGPFDLSGANMLHFDIHTIDSLGAPYSYSVILDNTTGGAPGATTLQEVAEAIQAATGSEISVGASPLILTVVGPGQDQNGGTIDLIPVNEAGITLAQLGFDINNRTATGVPDSSTADYLFSGTMTAQSILTNEIFSSDWNVYIDSETQQVFSNSAIVLPADEYQFNLLVSKDGVDYSGSALQTVAEGENLFAMDLIPIIGNLDPATTASQFNLNSTLTRYEISYAEAMPHHNLGISVNGGPEQLISISSTQVMSPRFYVDFNAGAQQIQLNLYDGPNLIGTSRSSQENQVITAGESIDMDIVPITGSAEFSLSNSGGSANINLYVPPEVLDEVDNNEANLGGLLSITGNTNSVVDIPFSVTANNANFMVNELQYGDSVFSLKFVELDSGDIVATCSSSITISTNHPAFNCDLNVRKRTFLEGSLLNHVGINVVDANGEPVPGAIVKDADQNVIGITGTSAFGATGFVNLILPSGFHHLDITSADGTLFGVIGINLNTLEVRNETVTLN